MGFTKDQEIASKGIIKFLNEPFNPNHYIIGLTGSPGVGKSYLTNWIINRCNLNPKEIVCSAPTHKACRVLSEALHGKAAETIQSVLGMRLDVDFEDFDPKDPKFSVLREHKLADAKVLLIDESSMIPSKLINYICELCCDLEIKIIFVGDANQLPPVKDLKSIAFTTCSKVFELKEIVRQKEGNPILELCSLLKDDIEHKTLKFIEFVSNHIGLMKYNDIGEGYGICGKEEFRSIVNRSFSKSDYHNNIDMYRIIAYTNSRVAGWNHYIRNSIVKDAHKAILTKNDLIMSNETIVNEFLEIVINNSEEYIVYDITNYVDDKYKFKGFLVKLQMVHGGTITRPLFIIDHTDSFTLQKYVKTVNDLISDAKKSSVSTRSKKWKEYYDFKKKFVLSTNIFKDPAQTKMLFQRDIDYGYAITAHRAQGSTYDTVFIDMNDMVYTKAGTIYADINDMLRRLYVACSRAKREVYILFGK